MAVDLIPKQLAGTDVDDATVAVLIAPGADLSAAPGSWSFTDVTSDVMVNGPVTVSVGRSDEQSQAQPASCSFALLNDDGDYTPRRPAGQFYPHMRLGFPVKVVVDSTETGEVELFTGYVDELAPSWDTSMNVATVELVAKGSIQRIQQGDAPRVATINRAALDLSLRPDVAAYWPMDEAADDTTRTFASGIGASPLNITGTDGMQFASFDGIPGSGPLAVFKAGTNINGPVDGPADTTGAVYFRCFLNAATALADSTTILRLASTGTIRTWRFLYHTGGALELRWYDASDSEVGAGDITSFGIDGRPFYLSIELVQDGSDIDYLIAVRKINADGTTTYGQDVGTVSSRTVGACTRIDMGGSGTMTDWAVGHMGVANTQSWLFANDDLLTGYRNEYVDYRVTRLCSQAGVPVVITDIGDTFMGPEGTSTLMDALRECEVANDGVLYDGKGFGLAFRCRRAKQNRAVDMALDIADGHVMPPFLPVENTQRTRNDITVTRKGGSTASVSQPEGMPYAVTGPGSVGRFEDSSTVNISSDTDLPGHAHWRLHLGTVDLDRYPNLNLDFTASPQLAEAWLKSPGVGARITVTGLPVTAGYDPDLFVEGYTTEIGPKDWRVSINCSPAQPYDTAEVNNNDVRVDTAAAVLDSSASAGATSLSVDSTPRRWSTSAGSFALNVGGYRVTCSAISGAGTVQTFTVSALPAALPAGTPVKVWYPAIVSLEG